VPVAAQVAFTTPYRTAPYLDVATYKAAPTGVDTSNLVAGGQPGTEDAVLADVIADASGWVDTIANQILAATVNTEAKRLRTRRDGSLIVHPDSWPVLEVRDLQYGATPASLTQLTDLSGLWIEEQQFIVTFPGVTTTTNVGPLQLGGLTPGQRLLVRYTYVNGWPNTLLTAAAAAGTTSIVVDDPTGIYAGTRLRVDSGSIEEQVTVTATPTSSTVAISALAYAHAAKVLASALPPAGRRAAILLTSALIKTRGEESLSMPLLIEGALEVSRPGQVPGAAGDVAIAKELISNLVRVR